MKNLLRLLLVMICVSSWGQSADVAQDINAVETGLIPGIIVEGQPSPKSSLAERMEALNVPGVSIAVIQDGKISWAKGYGIANSATGTKVDENTLFQAGSISKPLAALCALKLVEDGKVDLDANVNDYLVRWKVPENEFTAEAKVTLRRLLTHTAGMTVHGFPGYAQKENFPTDMEVLDGKGNTGPIRVDMKPGTQWRYSGGGYTVMENLVEDVAGMSLAEFADRYIFPKMKMSQSTFAQPLPEAWHAKASGAYDTEGNLIEGAWHNYPEQAAAGLWTTPSDLARYLMEIQQIMAGKTDGVLSKNTVSQMLTKDQRDWGLGPSLRGEGEMMMFGHGGKNAGFSNNMTAFVNKGEGAIVMTNADNGTTLMGEVFRAISNHYDWGVFNPEKIKTVTLSAEQLNSFPGEYVSTTIPGVDSYGVEVKVEGDHLVIYDPNENSTIHMHPISENEFRDLEEGGYIAFKSDNSGKVVSFGYNNRFIFDRKQ